MCGMWGKRTGLKLVFSVAEVEPVDILLLLASSEGDAPKVAELLAAGASTGVKVSKPCACFIISSSVQLLVADVCC